MRTQKLDYRLLVVDDGSINDTATILVKAKKKLPSTMISHFINRGLGETERDAFEFVAFNCDPSDLIVRVEGDATYSHIVASVCSRAETMKRASKLGVQLVK